MTTPPTPITLHASPYGWFWKWKANRRWRSKRFDSLKEMLTELQERKEDG